VLKLQKSVLRGAFFVSGVWLALAATGANEITAISMSPMSQRDGNQASGATDPA